MVGVHVSHDLDNLSTREGIDDGPVAVGSAVNVASFSFVLRAAVAHHVSDGRGKGVVSRQKLAAYYNIPHPEDSEGVCHRSSNGII